MAHPTPLHYYILSDSVGETATTLARSVLAQFPTIDKVLHKYTFISNADDLFQALKDAQAKDGLVFMTVVDFDLARQAEHFCVQTGLICYNLMQPYLLEIERRTHTKASGVTGAQHELTDSYFRRVEAMEFCMQVDDGRDQESLEEADIILLGVSRTGKTPLSMYLATMGYKVVNLPLLPESEVPQALFQVEQGKIIGLTNNPKVLRKHRINRMIEYGMPENSQYTSPERIQTELDFADQLYRQLQCPVLNVADRSIEESAAIIVDLLGLTLI